MSPNKRATLKVEYVAIRSVKPSRSNIKVHPPEQINEIIASIREFGWTKPIIVDERREILAGHGAHQAALQLGMTEVPIIARHGLSQAQKRAYRAADNKIAEHSPWDLKILAGELKALQDMGFDMTITGFKPGEIAALLRPTANPDLEPPIPQSKGPAVAQPGDLWLLAEHRLICADSTKPATWEALMGGRQASMVFTDPPYGVSFQGLGLESSKVAPIKGDDKRRAQLRTMLAGSFTLAANHCEGEAGWYIWHADKTRPDFEVAMRDVGLVELGMLIWDKGVPTMGWTDYRFGHEPCFYATRQGFTPRFYGDRTGTTIWRLESTVRGQPLSIGAGLIVTAKDGKELFLSAGAPKGKKVRHIHLEAETPLLLASSDNSDSLWTVARDTGDEAGLHPTQKPVELARRAIRNSSREGEIVADFFAGSGSTLIAAEQLGRACYAIDLEPAYIDATIRRWQEATGKTATHAQEQKTFEALTRARAGKKAAAR